MTRHTREPNASGVTLTRRRFLGSTTGMAGLTGWRRRQSSQNRITRRLVIPRADAFEDNYVGQFVFVDEPLDESPDDVPIEACEFADWSPATTRVYEGQLLDRRQELPVAVDLHIYENGDSPQIEPASHFIIQNTVRCPDGYVGLEVEWVTRRALAGKPPGPTVTPTGTDGQPGFGMIAAGVGLGVGVLIRALARRRSGR